MIDRHLSDRHRSICACQRCKDDIAAIALNYLPPHYVVDATNLPDREVGSPWVMVETAVVEAIDRVRENPNHPRHQDASVPSPAQV